MGLGRAWPGLLWLGLAWPGALGPSPHITSYRGEEMTSISLLDFMLDMYDAKAEQNNALDDEGMNRRQPGRVPNQRVPYRVGFKDPGRCRVFQTAGHETLPHFLGGWFPRND